jgi:tetratricopeptide (TPR) repeat protein
MARHHLTKKEMATDELAHALEGARDYVSSHQSQTLRWTAMGVGAVLLVAAIVGGFTWRERHLEERFSAAMGIFDAALVTDGVAAAPGQKVYKDGAERLSEARKALEELAKDAPSSMPGRAASLVLLGLDGKKGATGTAFDRVTALAEKDPGSMHSGYAALALLQARAAAGQTKEALDTAKRFLDSSSSPLPKDLLIFTLGQLSEKAGQAAEAKTYYQRVVSDFPDSPVRGEAQQRSQAL